MSTATSPAPVARRHALGLPAGSVRTLHAMMIVGLVCAIILLPKHMPIPPYLIYLLLLVLGHFFAAHGVSMAHHKDAGTPLHLPIGFVRFLIIVALSGSIGWKLYSDEDGLYKQFSDSVDLLKTQPFLPLLLLGAFFLGVSIRAIVGRDDPPQALQDLEAWLSILALIGLGAAVIIHLVIAPGRAEATSMPTWEGFVAAIIAFYFGERS